MRSLRIPIPASLCRALRPLVPILPGIFLGGTPLAKGADFHWNNGAGTAVWNATDANWSGATWTHSPSSNAFFSTTGGTVSLGEPVTAGAVTLGVTGYNAPNTNLTGGSLAAASLTVQGKADNYGNYTPNPTLTLSVPTVLVAGDIAVGRANLVVSSGTASPAPPPAPTGDVS
jgi:fibronectin-binding autotransporter adhesin